MKSDEREQIVPPPRPTLPESQAAIERLQQQCFVELATVQQFHSWLDERRQSRQASRVIGDSRTGKTIACESYRLKYATHSTTGG